MSALYLIGLLSLPASKAIALKQKQTNKRLLVFELLSARIVGGIQMRRGILFCVCETGEECLFGDAASHIQILGSICNAF